MSATEFIPDQTGGLLGRHKHHDPRNFDFLARELPTVREAVLRTQVWDCPWPPFDQGHEGSCTAQAAAGVLGSQPFRRPAFQWVDEAHERSILYRQAQLQDPFVETPPAEGSSTDAPFRALRDRGYIQEWRWCRGIKDLRDTVVGHGPCAVGGNWYPEWMQPDDDGFLKEPGRNSSPIGGHAWLVFGYYHPYNTYACLQSWGIWGELWGRFLVEGQLMERILEEDGEATTVVA